MKKRADEELSGSEGLEATPLQVISNNYGLVFYGHRPCMIIERMAEHIVTFGWNGDKERKKEKMIIDPWDVEQ